MVEIFPKKDWTNGLEITRRIGRAQGLAHAELAVQGRANNLRFLASAAVSSMKIYTSLQMAYVLLPYRYIYTYIYMHILKYDKYVHVFTAGNWLILAKA